jgi:multidrug resistance efflux pump
MSDTPNAPFEIECPCCGAILKISSQTQAVLQHREAPKKPLIEDLQSAVQQLKGDAERRNDLFEKSFASHRSGEKTRELKFEELLKQAKEDNSEPAPPKRLFDFE